MDLLTSASRDRFTSIPRIDFDSPFHRRGRDALRLLYDAYNYAEQNDGSSWDFAEEISSLQQRGIANSDLRFLMCIGYVERGHEVTKIGEECRRFELDDGLHFSTRTCFILTDVGASYVKNFLIAPANGSACQIQREYTAAMETRRPLKPVWNRDLQELRLGDKVVKRFKVPAPNQEIILAVFQEEDWPVYIDDPLAPHPEIDTKRRLRDTINSLNRNQKDKLLQFRGNGSGDGVRWELVPSVESTN